jgi:hypothetical protein
MKEPHDEATNREAARVGREDPTLAAPPQEEQAFLLTTTDAVQPDDPEPYPDRGEPIDPAQPAHPDAWRALDAYRSALGLVKGLTDLQLLTKIGEHLDHVTMPNPANALLLELDARIRFDQIKAAAPRLQTDRLLEGAASVAQQAQAIVAALADRSMTPSEANTALYALQVAASALRQLQPAKPVGRPRKERPRRSAPKKTPPPPPTARRGRARTTKDTTPTRRKRTP